MGLQRRREPRQPAGWHARYMLGGRPGWQSCRVVNVSTAGAALEIHDAVPSEGRVVVALELTIDPLTGIQLRGDIRNTRPGPRGSTRVGIEFVELTPLERDVLASLLKRQSA